MTDPRSTLQRSLALPLLLVGTGLAVLPAWWPVGAVAVLGPWLAQPALALGMALLSPAPEAPAIRVWWRDAITLAVVWGATFALLGLGFAWPWSSLLETGSLAAALGLGAVVGLAWTGAFTAERMRAALAALPPGLTEVYTHPATADTWPGSAPGYRYRNELAALTDGLARATILREGIAHGDFGSFRAASPASS